jgi:Cu/Ag efflux protein CusF
MKKFVAVATLALMASSMAQAADVKGMSGMDQASPSRAGKTAATHKATGVVKKVDAKAETISLAHEPVAALKWPAMTMTFKVADKAMLRELGEGRKVEVTFEQRGKEYVITSVK